MILRLSIFDDQTGTRQDIELNASPDSLTSSVLERLPGVGNRTCFVGGTRLDPRTTIAGSPLLHGCTITVGAAGRELHAQAGTVGVLFTEGPYVDSLACLTEGNHTVSLDPSATVGRDPALPRRLAVSVSSTGDLTVADMDSHGRAGGIVGNRPVLVRPGEVHPIGNTTLRWTRVVTPQVLEHAPDGRLDFDRAYAAEPAVSSVEIAVPAEEKTPLNVGSQLLSAAFALAVGVVMAALLHQYYILIFAVAAPIAVLASIGSAWYQRRTRRREYQAALKQAQDAATRHVQLESSRRHALAPDVHTLSLACVSATRGLWPRNRDTGSGLTLRLGLGEMPAAITLRPGPDEKLSQPVLKDVPITLDLRVAGVLGVVGPDSPVAALCRWLMLQLAALRSPDGLRLGVISASDEDAGLSWLTWLPHLDIGDDGNTPCRIGNSQPTRYARVAELRDLVRARTAEGRGPGTNDEDIVILLYGARVLRAIPGMKEVLRDGPSAGIYIIAADHQDINECRALATVDAGGKVLLRRSRDGDEVEARMDFVSLERAELLARAMAPMRDRLTRANAQTSIPHPVRLLDLFGIRQPTADDVTRLWQRQPGPTTEVSIGADGSGVVTVDLARQGPHTMLGGATGAGKSILLQTLVTSLLLANRPDELNLVLVDFKGGGAFGPFENCPHVVSLIVSTGKTAADVFDEAAADRVLASIRTEVSRRESILSLYGGEIDRYWAERRLGSQAGTGDPLPPLPRLVMVFDEFARVLDVSPGFLKELVNVAGKGRSLGMHLVLATQSLQGKLSAELKNNIELRITLRQNEPADSTEVLGVPDAAFIPGHLRGRGMILCTKDETRTPRPFQSGYLGDPPPKGGPPPVTGWHTAWRMLGVPRVQPRVTTEDEERDQELVITAIQDAATLLRVPAPFTPLLPPLEAELTLAALPSPGPDESAWLVPYGLIDDPKGQAQPAATLDLAGTDRLMVAGGPQSGRTTFARTLLTSIVERFSADQVHFYIFEQQPAGLARFGTFPHCGGVFSPTEPDRVRRLVLWLDREVTRRRGLALSAETGSGPKIVVILDGWEHFENRSDPGPETSLPNILRGVIATGTTVGVHIVVIGGNDMLSGKLPNLYSNRLLLPFPKQETRRAHLSAEAVTPPVLPGRAVDAGTGLQLQICWTDREAVLPDPPSRVSAPAGAQLTIPDRGVVAMTGSRAADPRRFPALPTDFTPADIPSLNSPSAWWVPLGIGGPDVTIQGVDLFESGSNTLLISGAPGTGRTTTVATLVHGLQSRQIPVIVVAPPRSPLSNLIPTGPDVIPLIRPSIIDADLHEVAKNFANRQYAVIIDDCDKISVPPPANPFDTTPTFLEEVLASTSLGRRALVVAGDATPLLASNRYMSKIVRAALGGHVLLLCPLDRQVARDHEITSLEPDQYFAGPPGRGYMTTGRGVSLVQVAKPNVG